MNGDIFGYNREIKEKQLISADNVSLDFGEGRVALVQSVEGSYAHKIVPVFETGSSSMFFVNGQPIGGIKFSSLVGKDGFFAGFNLGKQACGVLNTITTNIVNTSDGECEIKVEKNNAFKLEGAMLTSVSWAVRAGELQVVQGGDFQVAKLSVVS